MDSESSRNLNELINELKGKNFSFENDLSKEKQSILISFCKQGDKNALELCWLGFENFVRKKIMDSTSASYIIEKRIYTFEELKYYMYDVLCECVQGFDSEIGFKFSTYFGNAINNEFKEIIYLANREKRKVNIDDKRNVSLDSTIDVKGNGNERPLAEVIADPVESGKVELILSNDYVRHCLSRLPKDLEKIIRLNVLGFTLLDEIAKQENSTKQNVSLKKIQALELIKFLIENENIPYDFSELEGNVDINRMKRAYLETYPKLNQLDFETEILPYLNDEEIVYIGFYLKGTKESDIIRKKVSAVELKNYISELNIYFKEILSINLFTLRLHNKIDKTLENKQLKDYITKKLGDDGLEGFRQAVTDDERQYFDSFLLNIDPNNDEGTYLKNNGLSANFRQQVLEKLDNFCEHKSEVKTFVAANGGKKFLRDVFSSVLSEKETFVLKEILLNDKVSDKKAILKECSIGLAEAERIIKDINFKLDKFFGRINFKSYLNIIDREPIKKFSKVKKNSSNNYNNNLVSVKPKKSIPQRLEFLSKNYGISLDDIVDVFSKLSLQKQKLFGEYYIKGLSLSDIAFIYGLSANVVSSRLIRLREDLKGLKKSDIQSIPKNLAAVNQSQTLKLRRVIPQLEQRLSQINIELELYPYLTDDQIYVFEHYAYKFQGESNGEIADNTDYNVKEVGQVFNYILNKIDKIIEKKSGINYLYKKYGGKAEFLELRDYLDEAGKIVFDNYLISIDPHAREVTLKAMDNPNYNIAAKLEGIYARFDEILERKHNCQIFIDDNGGKDFLLEEFGKTLSDEHLFVLTNVLMDYRYYDLISLAESQGWKPTYISNAINLIKYKLNKINKRRAEIKSLIDFAGGEERVAELFDGFNELNRAVLTEIILSENPVPDKDIAIRYNKNPSNICLLKKKIVEKLKSMASEFGEDKVKS